jgi:hypothetical protein
MAYTPKPNSGSLFKNTRKVSESHPDYTGSVMLESGKEHYLSAWVKEGAKGKFFSISIGKVKEPVGFKAAGSDELPRNTIEDDSVPF